MFLISNSLSLFFFLSFSVWKRVYWPPRNSGSTAEKRGWEGSLKNLKLQKFRIIQMNSPQGRNWNKRLKCWEYLLQNIFHCIYVLFSLILLQWIPLMKDSFNVSWFYKVGTISRKVKELLNIHLGYDFAQSVHSPLNTWNYVHSGKRIVIGGVRKISGGIVVVGEKHGGEQV